MIVSLYCIKLLVFITEMEYVYCAVRTRFLNNIPLVFRFFFKLTPCAKLPSSAA
jgi:hypothetical protein